MDDREEGGNLSESYEEGGGNLEEQEEGGNLEEQEEELLYEDIDVDDVKYGDQC